MNTEITLEHNHFELDIYNSEFDRLFTIKGIVTVGLIKGRIDIDYLVVTCIEDSNNVEMDILTDYSWIFKTLKSKPEIQLLIEESEQRHGINDAVDIQDWSK